MTALSSWEARSGSRNDEPCLHEEGAEPGIRFSPFEMRFAEVFRLSTMITWISAVLAEGLLLIAGSFAKMVNAQEDSG